MHLSEDNWLAEAPSGINMAYDYTERRHLTSHRMQLQLYVCMLCTSRLEKYLKYFKKVMNIDSTISFIYYIEKLMISGKILNMALIDLEFIKIFN